jgi:hypothetical protein
METSLRKQELKAIADEIEIIRPLLRKQELEAIVPEIEIIRPLFRNHGLEDLLPQIKQYFLEYDTEYSYTNINEYSYTNIDEFGWNDPNYLIHIVSINYFGYFFTNTEKKFIQETLIEYLKKEITKYSYKLLHKRIIFNKKIGYYAFIRINKLNDIKIYLFKNFDPTARKSLFSFHLINNDLGQSLDPTQLKTRGYYVYKKGYVLSIEILKGYNKIFF